MAGGIFVALAAGWTAVITSAPEVRLENETVRLGDVAIVDGVGASRLSAIPIARLASGERRVLSRSMLRDLVRRAAPGVTILSADNTEIILIAPAARLHDAGHCFIAARPIEAGESVTTQALEPADCNTSTKPAPLVLKADTGALAAARPVRAGTYIGQVELPSPPIVRRGDALNLVSRAGPIEIVRPVRALQQAFPGQTRIFVETRDGAVFAAPVPEPSE